jgi:hypothetical protein
MRALAGGQQFQAVTDELGRRWQVDGTEVRQALAEQVVERHAEDGEDGYAEERLPGSPFPSSRPSPWIRFPGRSRAAPPARGARPR